MGIPHSSFEEKLEKMKDIKGVKLDTDLTAHDLKELVEQYKKVYLEATGEVFPSGTYNLTVCFTTEQIYNLMLINLYLQIQRSSCS